MKKSKLFCLLMAYVMCNIAWAQDGVNGDYAEPTDGFTADVAAWNKVPDGLQASWASRDVLTEDLLDARLFPRIFVLAEQMWNKGTRSDFDTFCRNVSSKKSWFEKLGYRFGPALREESK